jgi:hypothetical protein
MKRTSAVMLVFVAFALVMAACGDDTPATTTTLMPEPEGEPPVTAPGDITTTLPGATTEPPSDSSPQSWAEFEPAFMAGCTAQYDEGLCGCMFDEFQERYDFEDFFAWAYQAGDDPRITEVVDICER